MLPCQPSAGIVIPGGDPQKRGRKWVKHLGRGSDESPWRAATGAWARGLQLPCYQKDGGAHHRQARQPLASTPLRKDLIGAAACKSCESPTATARGCGCTMRGSGYVRQVTSDECGA